MDNVNELFYLDLIFTNINFKDKYECFEYASNFLFENGFVKQSFLNALIEREEIFPTGLKTNTISVAIPHTDPKHILKPFIAVIKPNDPIIFREMGLDNEVVEAQMIFILGIKKSTKQVLLLQKLMDLFQDQPFMIKLMESKNKEEIYNLLKTI